MSQPNACHPSVLFGFCVFFVVVVASFCPLLVSFCLAHMGISPD